MSGLVISEFMKLRRSLAFVLILSAPLCMAIFAAMILVIGDGTTNWQDFLREGLTVWGLFLLPLTIAALGVLVAQIEHGPRMWNHLLTLPVPRGRIFAAKVIVMSTMLALMQLLLFAVLPLTGYLTDLIFHDVVVSGAVPVEVFGFRILAMGAGSFLMLVIQLWVALRFRSFVPPLVVGIAGTFGGMMAASAGQPVMLPWLLQMHVLSWPDPIAQIAALISLGGGIGATALMMIDLGWRKEF